MPSLKDVKAIIQKKIREPPQDREVIDRVRHYQE